MTNLLVTGVGKPTNISGGSQIQAAFCWGNQGMEKRAEPSCGWLTACSCPELENAQGK